jgi:galactofuranosylgalactofuranosylrhamnosyl-N-acetylglucosaminyl-diphospho-decaprenol beta-1,5/1,6-galactofuranosyltransferase
MRKGYDDSRSEPDLDRFPPARRHKPPRRGKAPTVAPGRIGRVKTMIEGAARQVLPVRDLSRRNPEANIPHVDLKWWLLSRFDSALVSSADGSAASWYKRDPEQFRDLLTRSVTLHTQLAKEWPNLVKQYREALPELVSPQTWKATFDESTKPD